MKITLLTVGKTDKDWVRQGIDIYATRMKHYFPFSIVEIPELKNVSSLSQDQIKTKEGELILKNVKPTDDMILLDERGRESSSMEFAKALQDLEAVFKDATGKDLPKFYRPPQGIYSQENLLLAKELGKVDSVRFPDAKLMVSGLDR